MNKQASPSKADVALTDLHLLELIISLAVIHCPFEGFTQQINAKEAYLILLALPEIRFGFRFSGTNPRPV